MATYTVTAPDGNAYDVTAPDTASQDEVLAYAKENYQPSSEQPGFAVPPAVQLGAKALLTPGRGLRGLGVMAQKLGHAVRTGNPKDLNMQDIVSRASAATQPGYQAQPGEKLGSFGSALVDPVNLAAGLIPGQGGILKSIASGAGLAGGANLLDQAEQGRIDPKRLLGSSAIGAGLGYLTHGLSSAASSFIGDAPAMVANVTKIPKKSTANFIADKNIMAGAPTTEDAMTANLESKANEINQNLQGLTLSEKADRVVAGKNTGTNLTAVERSKFKAIPADEISDEIDTMRRLMPQFKQQADAKIQKARDMGLSPLEISKVTNNASSDALKRLLNIRQSIKERIGEPATFSMTKGGLADLRTEVNQMIEELPGGDVIRNADEYSSQVKGLHGKLIESLKTPEKTIEFVKSIMEGNTSESRENLILLLAMEKLSGRPVVDDMMKAITQSHFAPALANHTLKRSILGISPFLISGLMRVGGIPFQASLPAAAAITTAGQSPAVWGSLIRTAQALEPHMKTGAKATAVAGLAALRKMQEGQ